MGNDHLSRRSSPTASTSVAKRLGKVASFSVSPEGLGWRGQDGGDDGISAFMEMARARDETEEWKGAPPVPAAPVQSQNPPRLCEPP